MKVKVGNLEIIGKLSNVVEKNGEWFCCIKNEHGLTYAYKFTVKPEQVMPDTPQIEVGSEWVWVEAKETTTVKYAGDEKVFYKWNTDGSEGCEDIDSFLEHFKPKPKTVTMYFYKDCKGLVHSYSEVMPVFGDYLFTSEVEL